MKFLGTLAFAALVGAWAISLSTTTATASIVCNDSGACWHTHETYDYPSGVGVIVHPDNWRWRSDEHYAWKEHEGRGYWRGSEWKAF
jgi:hypothetical protein